MPNLPNIRRGRQRDADPVPASAPRAPDIQRHDAHGLTWIHIENPGDAEVRWLAENHDFHPLDLEDVQSRRRQRAKIDAYDEYIFVVLHFPRFNKGTGRLQPEELNVFVADGLIITIPNEPLKPLSALFSRVQDPDEAARLMRKGSGYLFYAILDTMADYGFPILDKISFKLDTIEEEMFEGRNEDLVRDISLVKQEILNYRKTIKPQRAVFRGLERYALKYAAEDLELYYDDIVDKVERAYDLLENYREVADALEATNESVLTHRLNAMVKFLTVLSAFVLPLTLIVGFYGMNIDVLPFAGSGGLSLVVTLGLMGTAAAGIFIFFRHRRWL